MMAAKLTTALQVARQLPSLAKEIVTVFTVAYYEVTYRKGRVQHTVRIVLSPRVVTAALRRAGDGTHESHSSRSLLCRQVNDAIVQTAEHEKFTRLEPHMLPPLLRQDDPSKDHLKVKKLTRRASLRDNLRYTVLGLLGRQDALLAPADPQSEELAPEAR